MREPQPWNLFPAAVSLAQIRADGRHSRSSAEPVAREPAVMGGDPHKFVPSERIDPETSILCATSVPFPGGRRGTTPADQCARYGRDRRGQHRELSAGRPAAGPRRAVLRAATSRRGGASCERYTRVICANGWPSSRHGAATRGRLRSPCGHRACTAAAPADRGWPSGPRFLGPPEAAGFPPDDLAEGVRDPVVGFLGSAHGPRPDRLVTPSSRVKIDKGAAPLE
jgi:hypothetical protein